MTVMYKSKQQGSDKPSDRARLRSKIGGLMHYFWRADLKDLAYAQMDTALNAYHADLLRYMRRDSKVEEVAAKLVRNILSDDLDSIIAEMESLREDAGVGDGLVEHYILSARPGEQVLENFDDAVDTFVEGLGLSRCPIAAVVHLDTDNPHIHIMVLRIDHETGEEVRLPRYDIIRGHQTLAVLEDKFGWAREEEARFQVINGRLVRDGQFDIGPANSPNQWPDEYVPRDGLSSDAKRKERRSGVESAERIVKRVVPDILEESNDLQSLLGALEKEGISLSRKGSGAQYRVTFKDANGEERQEALKASVLRKWSYRSIHAKFGDLPEQNSQPEQSRRDESIGGDNRRTVYAQAARQHREQMNSLFADVRASAKGNADLKVMISKIRESCAFPAYSDWANGAAAPDAAASLSEHLGIAVLEASGQSDTQLGVSRLFEENFVAMKVGRRVIYKPKSDPFSQSKIVDFGDRIIFVGVTADDALEQAIRLFKLRGATALEASGFNHREFRKAQKIAKDLGIVIVKTENIPKLEPIAPKKPLQHSAPIADSTRTSDDRRHQPVRLQNPPTQTMPQSTERDPSPIQSEKIVESKPLPDHTAPTKPSSTIPEPLQLWRDAEANFDQLRSNAVDKKKLLQQQVTRNRLASLLERAMTTGEIEASMLTAGEKSRLKKQVFDFVRRKQFQIDSSMSWGQ